MSDHERIWLQPECCVDDDIGRVWCESPDPVDCEDGVSWTEYVRADLYKEQAAENERLRADRQKLARDSYGEGWFDGAKRWTGLPGIEIEEADWGESETRKALEDK